MSAPDPQPDPQNESSDQPLGAPADPVTEGALPLSETGAESPAAEPLAVPTGYAPRKRAEVLDIDMGDGVILYDDDTSLVHHLNPSATLIWQLCDGTGTVGELARDIAAEYGLDEATIESQVAAVIAEFDALELVEDARDLSSEQPR